MGEKQRDRERHIYTDKYYPIRREKERERERERELHRY